MMNIEEMLFWDDVEKENEEDEMGNIIVYLLTEVENLSISIMKDSMIDMLNQSYEPLEAWCDRFENFFIDERICIDHDYYDKSERGYYKISTKVNTGLFDINLGGVRLSSIDTYNRKIYFDCGTSIEEVFYASPEDDRFDSLFNFIGEFISTSNI